MCSSDLVLRLPQRAGTAPRHWSRSLEALRLPHRARSSKRADVLTRSAAGSELCSGSDRVPDAPRVGVPDGLGARCVRRGARGLLAAGAASLTRSRASGMLHTAAGLANATANGWPMLLLSSAPSSKHRGRGGFQVPGTSATPSAPTAALGDAAAGAAGVSRGAGDAANRGGPGSGQVGGGREQHRAGAGGRGGGHARGSGAAPGPRVPRDPRACPPRLTPRGIMH